MEALDDKRGNGVQRTGLLNDLHEYHCRGNDHDRVNIGKHTLDQMAKRQALPAGDRTGDGRQHHGQADRQLAEEAAEQEYRNHDKEGDQFCSHNPSVLT